MLNALHTGDGCVVTGNVLVANDLSKPTRIPLATCIVRVSTDVRMKISFSFTERRKPSFLLYTDQKSYGVVSIDIT